VSLHPSANLRPTVTVLAVIALGLGGWLGYQGLSALSTTRQLRSESAMLAQEQALASELREAQATTKRLREQVRTHPSTWSWGEQLPFMIDQVSVLVRDSGVRVQSMQPAPVVEAEKLARFPLRLSLDGSLASVVVFLRRAREQSPALGVDQFNLHTGTDPGDLLRAEVTLSSYVVLQGAAKGAKP
jgi:Tfp pilus assembly protein PilO